ncbi:hypothetical protein DL769_004325 [Monosporascus sp. CRB-8-3]|nr:hypothetical protein DL769_004325 [Monosporascus sp. CRB-8-3]
MADGLQPRSSATARAENEPAMPYGDSGEKAQPEYALDPLGSDSSVRKNGRRTLASADGGPERVTAQEVENAGDGSSDQGRADVTEYKVYKRRWFGLLQLTLLNIVVSWDWMTFAPVAHHAALYYGVSESAVNWLSTGFLFAFVVVIPVTIYTLHLGPKPSIATSALLILVGNWVRFAGSHSRDGGIFGVVMFGQILTGLSQPFVLSAPTRYSDLWFTDRGRVAATALPSLANPFGAALGQLIVPFMVNGPADMSNAVLYVAIISSICALPSFFIPSAPPTPPSPSGTAPKASLRASIPLLRSLEVWLLLIPFSVYVGLFNSLSSLLNQIMRPYGYTPDNAGIAGALLIVVGLVCSAVTSPILDRTKAFMPAIRTAVPLIGLCYLAFVWMPATRGLAGPYVVLSVLGAASFSLVPVALEFLCELSHPLSPAFTSTVAWGGGQILGAVFILIGDALKADDERADPPGNMRATLIFTAVVALAVAPLPLALGLFGRGEMVAMRRLRIDDDARR